MRRIKPDCRRAAHRRIRQRYAGRVRRAQQIFQLPQTGLTDRATWQALAGLHNALFRRTPLDGA
ncbi:MAG: hypothetical protein ACLRVN_03230 [Butyricicoccus sp.]